ncbi:MAG: hypothetical protein AB7N54_10345 [Alphaproteobacteria bacterium]
MSRRAACAAGALLAILLGAPGALAAPAAVVVVVAAGRADVAAMDYLDPGREIRLAAGETLVLGYLASCWQEEITGGTVRIGERWSEIAGGVVKRNKVRCAERLDAQETAAISENAASAIRDAAAGPPVAVHDLRPVLRLPAPGAALTVERLDTAAPVRSVEVAAGALSIDLAEAGVVLERGGVYRARAAGRSLVFVVDRDAADGRAASPFGRILRFE